MLVFAIDSSRLLRDLIDILCRLSGDWGSPLLLVLCVSPVFRLTTETEFAERLVFYFFEDRAGSDAG